MPYFDFIGETTANGNVAHIAEHDLTPEDIEPIVLNPDRLSVSRSSGRPIAFGFTDNGREIAVVYEQIDEYTVYPMTAFEVGQSTWQSDLWASEYTESQQPSRLRNTDVYAR